MKFAANLSTVFSEVDLLASFDEAKKYGFTAVEIQNPYKYSYQDLKKKTDQTGLKVTLLNCMTNDDYGCASIPGRNDEFMMLFSKSLKYAFELGVRKLHIQSGLKNSNFSEEEQMDCFITNLTDICEVLENNSITGVIEPICPEVISNYYLDSFDKALSILEKVQNERIQLLLDIFHLKKIQGNTSPETLQKFYGYTGHIQVSQDPDRTEPFHPQGQINYSEVFHFLKERGHNDFIGLEYFPSGSIQESLKWLEDFKC